MRRFTFVLPPGWVRLDLTQPIEGVVAGFVREVLSRVPADQRRALGPKVRTVWQAHLTELSNAGALCLITGLDAGLLVGFPAIVVSDFPAVPGESPVDVLVSIAASDPSASLFDVNDLVAIRTVEDRLHGPEFAEQLASYVPASEVASLDGVHARQRMHRYLLGDPTAGDRWVALTGTTTVIGDASPEALEIYSDLLDDVVSSFRWTE